MTKLSMSEEEMLKRKYTRPYEKRIAELKDYNKKLLQSDIDKQNKIVLLSKKVNDLQKENIGLKDYRLTTVAKQQTDISKYALNLEHKLSWYDDQLTKAKEIIKELYEGLDKLYLSGLSDKQIAFIERLQDKVEQFLKGVEK